VQLAQLGEIGMPIRRHRGASAARSKVPIRGGARWLAVCLITAGLGACATPPRGPAETLANAGIISSNALARDYRTTASGLREVAISDAFANTLAVCTNPANCGASIAPADSNTQAREELARAIELRGRAADALSNAYSALKTEADYDAKGDLVSATNGAVDSINSFSTAILAVTGAGGAPGAALISEPLKSVTAFGAGLLADRSQTRRLMHASRAIAGATTRLRDALSVEAYVFNDLADYLVKKRVSARLALLKSGLASNQSVVMPMIQSLELEPADGMEATIRESPAKQAAVQAMVKAEAQQEIAQVRGRYAAELKALDQLIDAHASFERKQPLSLAELNRFLSELDVAISVSKQEKSNVDAQ
jgi:hypothetical protein